MTFEKFGFTAPIAAGIAAAGYVKPTPIQSESIPVALKGADLLGIAQTGTGKTAAFVLPILQRLGAHKPGSPRCLIVCPTRELAEQIQDTVRALAVQTGLRSATIYGGVGMTPQVQNLKRGVDIVVACPGRLLDHMQQRTIKLDAIELLVLDEADQMFDMGFLPSIERILKALPRERQTMLFSATMPDSIRTLSSRVLKQPKTVQIGHVAPAQTVSHALYAVPKAQKSQFLLHFLQKTASESVLVFMRTKHAAKKLAVRLEGAGYDTASLQGNLSQNKRQEAIDGFRSGKYKILVATDIAARGIDVSRVSHVINFDVPSTAETYTHRIGRTGRAERNGEAVTFMSSEDTGTIRDIERLLGKPLPRKTLEGFVPVAEPRSATDDGPRGGHRRPEQRHQPRRGGNQRHASRGRRQA